MGPATPGIALVSGNAVLRTCTFVITEESLRDSVAAAVTLPRFVHAYVTHADAAIVARCFGYDAHTDVVYRGTRHDDALPVLPYDSLNITEWQWNTDMPGVRVFYHPGEHALMPARTQTPLRQDIRNMYSTRCDASLNAAVRCLNTFIAALASAVRRADELTTGGQYTDPWERLRGPALARITASSIGYTVNMYDACDDARALYYNAIRMGQYAFGGNKVYTAFGSAVEYVVRRWSVPVVRRISKRAKLTVREPDVFVGRGALEPFLASPDAIYADPDDPSFVATGELKSPCARHGFGHVKKEYRAQVALQMALAQTTNAFFISVAVLRIAILLLQKTPQYDEARAYVTVARVHMTLDDPLLAHMLYDAYAFMDALHHGNPAPPPATADYDNIGAYTQHEATEKELHALAAMFVAELALGASEAATQTQTPQKRDGPCALLHATTALCNFMHVSPAWLPRVPDAPPTLTPPTAAQ